MKSEPLDFRTGLLAVAGAAHGVAGTQATPVRPYAGSHDRLIFNDKGESVRAIDAGKGLTRIQVNALLSKAPGHFMATTSEVELKQREAVAFALQILTVAGYAAEVRNVR